MADELDDEERELLEKHRAKRKAERAKADEDLQVEIWDDTGKGARLPYAKGRSWLQRTFGIDLDDGNPAEDEPPADEEPAKVRPAHFGRRSG